jgi:hypothetical protein
VTISEALRAVLIETLIYHQRMDAGQCTCGWGEWGASHSEHVADQWELGVMVLAIAQQR